MAHLPGAALARDLIEESRGEAARSPMNELLAAVAQKSLGGEAAHRLLGRLWTLERMFYYVYGGWGQGLEVGDFPPSLKYLFSKQILDDSTHEMLYLDALLRMGAVKTQKEAFEKAYGRFVLDSALAYYVFSLRNLATYPHPIRIAALNLGPKVLELDWMEKLAAALGNGAFGQVFSSQAVENRSHVNMGRRIVEEFVQKPVEAELCRWACRVAKEDYGRFLGELSDFVLGREPSTAPNGPARIVTD
jgi:hypothetical protein